MAVKLDYFIGLVSSINKKYKYGLSVEEHNNQIELRSKKGRVYGTNDPIKFESALKSLKKDGTISHRLFEERKDYTSFIEDKRKQGVNPKAAHLEYFKNLL